MVSLTLKTLAVFAAAAAVQATGDGLEARDLEARNYELLTTQVTLLVPKGSFKTKTVTKYKTKTVTVTGECGPAVTDSAPPPEVTSIITDTFPLPTDPSTFVPESSIIDTFVPPTETIPVTTDPFPTATDTLALPSETLPAATDPFPTISDPFPAATEPPTNPFPTTTATDTFSISDPLATFSDFGVGTDTVVVTITTDPAATASTTDPAATASTTPGIFGRKSGGFWAKWQY